MVAVVFVLLLLHEPAPYAPFNTVGNNQLSPYLTHELSPQFYNGIQRQEPFELVITQGGVNDIIARTKWPKQSDGIIFSAPNVLFIPDATAGSCGAIVVMATAVVSGAEFVVTVIIEPFLDEQGLLNLHVAKVKVGAMNITPLAKLIAGRMYQKQLSTAGIDTQDMGSWIAASLLNNKPFEPVFEIDRKKLQVEKVTVTNKKLTLRLAPHP